MTKRIWDDFLTERDKQVFAAAGFGALAGFGQKPALLIIDVNYNFCGDKREPILESVKRWRTSCGEDAWDALPVLRKLIDSCHTKGVPVIYTTGGGRADGWDAGSWAWKNSRQAEAIKSAPVPTTRARSSSRPTAPRPRSRAFWAASPKTRPPR